MKKLQLKDLAAKHDYYAHASNHYSNKACANFKSWSEFYSEFKDADIDMNLVYRWDLYKIESEAGYFMQITIIQQRKGIYFPCHIESVQESDVTQIIQFLKPHFEKLMQIWLPLSHEFSNPTT